MTTLHVVNGSQGGNLTRETAKRLREELAGRQISKTWLSTQLGVSKMWLSRRTSGITPMSTEDLDRIERETGIDAGYLITGERRGKGGDGPGGQEWPVTRDGLNPPTLDYIVEGSNVRYIQFGERQMGVAA